eukprot:CAMPEP_0117480032 /NCGR_PEP_ID=MMETSP0784-20121206/12186_1 /TAXON_ID=39447 /ORGANISM="" /LENGTH=86 /DNA_ID=CAMNT_0005274467 /DNA_START=272 /DNA_END=528 /DNA_ORIENTATION=-
MARGLRDVRSFFAVVRAMRQGELRAADDSCRPRRSQHVNSALSGTVPARLFSNMSFRVRMEQLASEDWRADADEWPQRSRHARDIL